MSSETVVRADGGEKVEFKGTKYDNSYRVKVLPEWEPPPKSPDPEDSQSSEQHHGPIQTELSHDNAADYQRTLLKENRAGWRGRIDFSLRELSEAKVLSADATIDQNSLLELVISSIVMLARGLDLPEEHMICTEVYLDNVRDEFGEHPPNIEGLLQHLKNTKDGKGITYNLDDHNKFDDDVDHRLRLTKIPKCTPPLKDAPPEEEEQERRQSRKSE